MQISSLSRFASPSGIRRTPGILLTLAFTFLVAGECAVSQIVFRNPGPTSAGQVLKDLQHGAVVMTVAVRPGDEDFSLLSHLRYDEGCKVRTVYISNGESIPSTSDADPDGFIGGTRKLEAAKSAAKLDAAAYFLNLPDPGAVGSASVLDTLWGSTLTDQLAVAIQRLHPQVIILMPSNAIDAQGSTLGWRLRKSTEQAMIEARRDSLVWSERDSTFLPSWEVQTAWMADEGKGKGASVVVTSSAQRRTIRRAMGVYGSRQVEVPVNWRSAKYVRIRPAGETGTGAFASGLQLTTPRFSDLAEFVQSLYQEKDRTRLLSKTVFAISQIDPILGRTDHALTPLDKYTLADWKEDLERLRFRLLDVNLEVSVSDSIVTRLQVFFVRVRFPKRASIPPGDTYVLFTPNEPKGWWYSRRQTNYIKLVGPDTTIEIVTPENLELNYPFERFGAGNWRAGDPFTFFVIHKDPDPVRNYLEHLSVDLLHPPVGLVEVTTPRIAWHGDPAVGVRVMSASRDRRTGVVFVSDTICSSDRYRVSTSGKDVVVDTSIALQWKQTEPALPAFVGLHNSRVVADSFEVVRLDVSADSTRTVALFTDRRRSPYALALPRVHARYEMFRLDELAKTNLAGFSTVIVEREKSDRPLSKEEVAGALDWVRTGGHLLVLNTSIQDETLGYSMERTVSLAPDEAVEWTGAAAGFGSSPFALNRDDWRDWKFARAWSGLRIREGSSFQTCLRSSPGGLPLIATRPLGRGTITVSALNLGQQLEAVHTGAYKIFVNLLSAAK